MLEALVKIPAFSGRGTDTMARNTYAKPTTTNASFMKVPVNLSSSTNATLTWGQVADLIPLCVAGGTSPIKAIKLGAITVGGSPDAPAHLEFKGGQTFDLPALATKPMRVKASDKNLYVSGWRRIEVSEQNEVSVLSNTDDDVVTDSVVFSYRGQIAYIEVALRFYDDEGYRPWYVGEAPDGPFETIKMLTEMSLSEGKRLVKGPQYILHYTESDTYVFGEVMTWSSVEQAQSDLDGGLLRTDCFGGCYGYMAGNSGYTEGLFFANRLAADAKPVIVDGQVWIETTI